MADNVPNMVVLMAVAFFLSAVFIPIVMNEVVSANTTAWNTSVVTIWSVLLPILFIIGVAIHFIPKDRKDRG